MSHAPRRVSDEARPKRRASLILWPGTLVLAVASLGVKCGREDDASTKPAVKRWTVDVVRSYPHDVGSFTQGLVFHNGALYETTGQYGQSVLRKLELESGKVLKEARLPDDVFGEGMTIFDGEILVLTWKEGRGFAFEESETGFVEKEAQGFRYDGEGWGLTHDGRFLIQSNGTDKLAFLNPKTRMPVREVAVTMNGKPLTQLNELEYFDGKVWANVWQTEFFVGIDPTTGEVTDRVDCPITHLFQPGERRGVGSIDNVLNGIAFDAKDKRLFITGKRWPKIFEVQLVEKK